MSGDELRDEMLRAQLTLAFRSVKVAHNELAQVTRCLALAILALMKEDTQAALDQLAEIHPRLAEAEKYMARTMSVIEQDDNAS